MIALYTFESRGITAKYHIIYIYSATWINIRKASHPYIVYHYCSLADNTNYVIYNNMVRTCILVTAVANDAGTTFVAIICSSAMHTRPTCSV